jgi:hypothetical protein
MQENPPAAAASPKLADIFKASRRLRSGMMLFSGFGLKGLGKFAILGIQGRLTSMSTKMAFTDWPTACVAPGGDSLQKSALAVPLPARRAYLVGLGK